MKVAITQNRISMGGRLSVIISIIKMFNERDVIPDIITFQMNPTWKEVQNKYGDSIKYNVRTIKIGIFRKLPELDKLWFNLLLNFILNNYSLVINSNNTSCLLRNKEHLISYIHYPRKARFHNAKLKFTTNFKSIIFSFEAVIARVIYMFDKMKNMKVITNSKFTRSTIQKYFNIPANQIKVVYPPVAIDEFINEEDKKSQLVSIGRFMPDKRQYDQIKVAEKLPSLNFNIIGFVANSQASENYFQKCQHYIKQKQLVNVKLFPNCSFDKMKQIMSQSKYFLHMLDNEPFGITTVQAISAGCIPIVPDSGGQKDIVTIKELRYKNFNDIIFKLKNLEKTDLSEYREQLRKNICKFTNDSFAKNMYQILSNFNLFTMK